MIKGAIVKIVDKQDLTYDEAYAVISEIMGGETSPTQNAAFLAALATKSTKAETIEEITGSYPGVEKSYAIQAGREVRVMVKPEQVSEDQMVILAHDLARRIESELEYPGQIKVHVLRETKVVEYAK